jgi:hypothetical protein
VGPEVELRGVYFIQEHPPFQRSRVDLHMTKHLSAQDRRDPRGEGFIVFGVQKKLEPLLLAHTDTLTIVKNGLNMRKFWPFIVEE